MSKKRKDQSANRENFSYSVSDPAFAEFLRMSGISDNYMDETRAMGLTAYYRALALISGTIAGLPLKVYRGFGGQREQVPHWLSTNPAGPFDLSAYSWREMLMLHLLNHAEGYLKSIYNEAGELIGLWPIHPQAISKVEWDGPDKVFTISMKNGQSEVLTTGELTQVLGMTSDGLRGLAPLSLFRQTLQTSRAGEIAANRAFTTGALIRGLVTTNDAVTEEEAKAIKEGLQAKIAGAEHANDIAFVNRALNFTPWSLSAVDAQFLESRGMQVEEVARIFGVPINLLSVAGAISNYGTGQAEQNLGLQKYVLMGWSSRIESSLSAILPPDYFAEFDYSGLLQGTPSSEIQLLIAQINSKFLTINEARAIRNLPPVPWGNAPAGGEDTAIEKKPASQGGQE